jgi:hypothetical protein
MSQLVDVLTEYSCVVGCISLSFDQNKPLDDVHAYSVG